MFFKQLHFTDFLYAGEVVFSASLIILPIKILHYARRTNNLPLSPLAFGQDGVCYIVGMVGASLKVYYQVRKYDPALRLAAR